MAAMKWLLAADPAIRWQVMRDLTGEPDDVVAAERARVAAEGWGARLLALQSPKGQWFSDVDQGWMITIHSLALLRRLGADPADARVRNAIDRVREHLTWTQLDGRPFFEGETEPCLNGSILGSGAYFGVPVDKVLQRLLDEQLEDGGWNCDAPTSMRASFNTTICVLEGLLEYEKAHGPTSAVTQARVRGQAYFLDRRMLRSRTTGQVIDRRWLRFTFPLRWQYDVLRGLDYMRDAGVTPDERVAEAVALVRKRAHQNGRWPLNVLYPDRVPFDMEPGVGKASWWNTLRALRVLKWYGDGEATARGESTGPSERRR